MRATRAKARPLALAGAAGGRIAPEQTTPGRSKELFAGNERATIEKIFTEHGLPGYIGWGIYGAESSYGKVGLGRTGGFGFGLIEPSYNGKSPREGQLYYNAEIAAETLEGLLRSEGGLANAVWAYSGHSYHLGHLAELGHAGGSGGNFHESHPGAGPEGLIEPGIGGELNLPSIPNPLEAIGNFFSLLTSGETWLRIGEVLAGVILLFLGLKNLTGAELPSVVPVPV